MDPSETRESKDKLTPAETRESKDKLTPAETRESKDKLTPAETLESKDKLTPAETRETKDKLTPAETRETKDKLTPAETRETKDKLTPAEVRRYGRQMILPEIGLPGQLSLGNGRVVVVGAGGLGCPALLYLSSCGVGHITIVDDDVVDFSNLHRQVLHGESDVGSPKCQSAVRALMRYLLNDACVILNKVLVSGSALRGEGQLTTYHFNGGPCYRCFFPTPPPPDTVSNCSDVGVVGAIVGIIGSMQAMEVIKLLTMKQSSWSQKMVLVDGFFDGAIRTVKMRGRRMDCAVCGENPTVTSMIDYEAFCGIAACDLTATVKLLLPSERISVQAYQQLLQKGEEHILIDTRPPVQFHICSLPDAVNVPFQSLMVCQDLRNVIDHDKRKPIVVVCRRGNDSQLAVRRLKELPEFQGVNITDIEGGLQAWSNEVDDTFPLY